VPTIAANLARKAVYAPRGVVATSQPLAATAGLGILRAGGNAVDAALASAIAHTIVSPGSNDIGGDLFAIVWDGERLHGLNASGRSPAALTLEAVSGGTSMPTHGWLPVTVPGAPAGWRDLHERFGSLPFETLFEDAITFASKGYPVSPRIAAGWARTAAMHTSRLTGPEFDEWTRVYTSNGAAPAAGERFINEGSARTLELIAATRAEAFYSGEIAQALAAHAAATGGLITLEDLANHSSLWVDPISVRYRDHEVWELPPNGQGIAALIALGLLDGVDLARKTPAERMHLQIEAMKLGYADANAFVADPEIAPAPVAELLSEDYLAARRALLTDKAQVPEAGDPVRGGTIYLCAADSDGMMVSLIQSNYMGFGSHVVLPGYGFNLQNRGAGFSVVPGHPNVAAGGKRPFHTIIPGFLTKGGRPVGPFGVMGGHMQPQGHLQVVMSTVDDGVDPQRALDRPRWRWETDRDVFVEPAVTETAVNELRDRGHQVTVEDSSGFGYGQAIWRLDDGPGAGSGYVAGSEARADGLAMGY
jgi:gamma-glutamyltranspeptidase/glutathione hydrolase